MKTRRLSKGQNREKNKNFQILAPLEIKILTRALSKTVFLLGYVIIFGPFRLLGTFPGLVCFTLTFERRVGRKSTDKSTGI